MSLIPLLASLAREIDNSHVGLHDIDDGFGFGMYPCDIYQPRRTPFQLNPILRYVPYERSIHKIHGIRDSKEKLTVGKNGFQVSVDVTQFKPNELTVKTVGNQVVVEGKHEEREDDHGYISRQFVRKYNLPTGFNPSDVISTISTDGVLTVKAPPPVKGLKNSERIVQIQQTGPAHLSVKDNQEEDPSKQPNGGPTKAEGNSKA